MEVVPTAENGDEERVCPTKPATPAKRKAEGEPEGSPAASSSAPAGSAAAGAMFRRVERGVEYDIVETEDGGYKRRRVGSVGKARQWHYFCLHGTRKERCKLCGGSSICKEHGNLRNICKACAKAGTGGASICEHGKEKAKCKPCGGSAICEHGREQHQCRKCGGASICEHKRQKSVCKRCKALKPCQHGKPTIDCEICSGPDSICQHGKVRKECTRMICQPGYKPSEKMATPYNASQAKTAAKTAAVLQGQVQSLILTNEAHAKVFESNTKTTAELQNQIRSLLQTNEANAKVVAVLNGRVKSLSATQTALETNALQTFKEQETQIARWKEYAQTQITAAAADVSGAFTPLPPPPDLETDRKSVV